MKGVAAAAFETESNHMASFLAARGKQASKPDVPDVAKVEAFMANEPIEVSPVNVAGHILEELLQVIGGPIPELDLDQPLRSNIQHILEDHNLELEDSVGTQGENFEHPDPHEEVDHALAKPLSPISEEGASSRILTPDQTRGPTSPRVDRASGSKRPRLSRLLVTRAQTRSMSKGPTGRSEGN